MYLVQLFATMMIHSVKYSELMYIVYFYFSNKSFLAKIKLSTHEKDQANTKIIVRYD